MFLKHNKLQVCLCAGNQVDQCVVYQGLFLACIEIDIYQQLWNLIIKLKISADETDCKFFLSKQDSCYLD